MNLWVTYIHNYLVGLTILKKRGKVIRKHLENYHDVMTSGFVDCNHEYSLNGTISCRKCGKIRF